MCSSPALCLDILCSKRKIWKKLIHFYRRAKKTSQVIGLQTARKNKILCLILFIPKILSLNLWNITMVKLWRKQKMHNKFSIVQHKVASVEYSQSTSSQETIIQNSCTEFEKKTPTYKLQKIHLQNIYYLMPQFASAWEKWSLCA